MNDVNLINSNPSRHTLVWIRPEYRASVAAQVTDDAMHTQVIAWLASDRPLVVARQPVADVGAGHAREFLGRGHEKLLFGHPHGPLLQFNPLLIADTIAVGLALPPALGKRRIALSVAVNDIARHTPPMRLADAIAHAPFEWQPALTELVSAATKLDLELRVFGSLAWQALSGIEYLTPQSDIDLLWHPQSHAQLQQGIALLARWEQASGLRADGEVLFDESSAVSWREWSTIKSGDDQRVLVKRTSSAELVDARELLELLA